MRNEIDALSTIAGTNNVGFREGRSRAAGVMTNRRQTDDWALYLQAVLLAVTSRISRV
jgi:hypothetical protein